ncbi:MAG TPA: PduL/EutD family phosphate acyltransferase, partial [Clostridia bacterium]|nr:PduL/EutD family phosphate acyltransferase [Clostridia bacterium]
QPGEFLSNERVDVVGPKRTLGNVAVLGPLRAFSQVEMSMTDCKGIGVEAPVRESGDVAGSGAVTLVGPKGTLELREGLIVAKRHVHMTSAEAEAAGLQNKQIVSVRVPGKRPLVFGDVVVRVSDKFKLAFHIDTDEANAAGADIDGLCGEIIPQ